MTVEGRGDSFDHLVQMPYLGYDIDMFNEGGLASFLLPAAHQSRWKRCKLLLSAPNAAVKASQFDGYLKRKKGSAEARSAATQSAQSPYDYLFIVDNSESENVIEVVAVVLPATRRFPDTFQNDVNAIINVGVQFKILLSDGKTLTFRTSSVEASTTCTRRLEDWMRQPGTAPGLATGEDDVPSSPSIQSSDSDAAQVPGLSNTNNKEEQNNTGNPQDVLGQADGQLPKSQNNADI
jgi:hypothetical protein